MSKNTKEAFIWIISILKKKKIKFVICGGLAAKIYGSKRALADIDIDIPSKSFSKIYPLVKEYIVYGPKIYKNKNFNLLLMTLKYKGQLIDLCGAENQRIFNKKTKKWEILPSYFANSINKQVYGKKIKIISLKDLINYKIKLSRRVDLIDINNLEKYNKL